MHVRHRSVLIQDSFLESTELFPYYIIQLLKLLIIIEFSFRLM